MPAATATPIDPMYLGENVAIRKDIDILIGICRGRTDMLVTDNKNEEGTGSIEISLNLPDNPAFNGATIFQAQHNEGSWWVTSFDARFMPGVI